MSITNKKKDHLKEHGGVELVEPFIVPRIDDPLRFWTDHPTENFPVDLRVFATGEGTNPGTGPWAGAFTGRPELIAELAPVLKARLTLATVGTCRSSTSALRAFWRVFDKVESKTTAEGTSVETLRSVRDLTHLHEAAAQAAAMDASRFGHFVSIANAARQLLRLGPLHWTIPRSGEPNRQIIPDDQAKLIRIAIKRDWQKTLQLWESYDKLRDEAERKSSSIPENHNGKTASESSEQSEVLRINWLHLQYIQKKYDCIVPTTTQLLDGVGKEALRYREGIDVTTMRAIAFPTLEQADIAFHMALAGCGWNPSTLVVGIDATLPERVFQHPKDAKQSVLVVEEKEDEGEQDPEEVSMQGSKRRAGGRLQFCMGLKKNPACPPNIIATYLQRTAGLRKQLRKDCDIARTKLELLVDRKCAQEEIEQQFKHLQTLQQGLRNVWLYLDRSGEINWLSGTVWDRYRANSTGKRISYLTQLIERLNVDREPRKEPAIARVVPSDFRDIYARWIHVQTGGNVIAVMYALGHSTLRSTDGYLTNNIFSAESDDEARQFMTHLFAEIERGRLDLTILAQLVRHGALTPEMQARLTEYRSLMRSRIKVACADAKHPPPHIAPDHPENKWCDSHRCLRKCQNARFLPESVDGIAMRVEELLVISDHLPLETWLLGKFDEELESGEYLLAKLYFRAAADSARAYWRQQIESGKHVVPGVGLLRRGQAA